MGKGWTDERRARQAEAIQRWRPWLKSTGPKSAEGKKVVAGNATKHGHRSEEFLAIKRLARRLIKTARDTA